MTGAPLPDPPGDTPPPKSGPLTPLREALGEILEIVDVDDLDGMPIVVTKDGARYLCTSEWPQSGATHIQAHLATAGNESFVVRVVEEKNQVGFRTP